MLRPQPRSTLFPYTTLFRSIQAAIEQARNVHLADSDVLGDLRLGHALEEAELDDASLPGGEHVQQLGDLGTVLDPLELGVVVAQARSELAALVVRCHRSVERDEAVQRAGLHRL